jgi:hypothetical protein
MADTMKVRMAKAAAHAAGYDPDDEFVLDAFVEQMDAVLSAMRTPTKQMAHAGGEVSSSPTIPAEVWNAMIDVARNETSDT